jgi:N-acyl-D-amino-acid deacylase
MSDLSKIVNQQEMNLMRSRLESAMEEGAIGFSTGNYYKTTAAADEDEIVSLAKDIAPFKGIYATHMRNEQIGIFKSLNETFLTAKRSKRKSFNITS